MGATYNPSSTIPKTKAVKSPIIILLALIVASCSQQRSVVTMQSYKAVERVKIGMSISKAVSKASKGTVVEKSTIPAYEGQPSQIEYRVFEGKKMLYTFNAKPNSKTQENVFRIVIYDPRYKTPEGLSVGCSVKEIRLRCKLKAADFNQDDGLFVTASSFDGGFLMNLDASKEYKSFDYLKPTISTLPEELTVKAIVLF